MVFEPQYDSLEYVSPSRQKIKRLLADWYEEIKEAKRGELSEQKFQDIEREKQELQEIMTILSQVAVDPMLDPLDPSHEAVKRGLILY